MRLKYQPGDFKVQEVISEKLKRKGKYRVYLLKKVGMETEDALKRISKVSKIPISVIRYGGRKDKNAETLQYVAVPKRFKLHEVNEKNLQLQEVGFINSNLSEIIKGNRFEILIRGIFEIDDKKFNILKTVGIPNYYGEQRFISSRNRTLFVQYLKNPEEAVKFLFEPAGFENSKERKGKKAFLKGDFKKALTLLKGWRKKVCKFLLEGNNLGEAFKLIPSREIEFQINVLQSFMFNEKLKRLIEESGVKTFKLRYRMGELLYPREEVDIPKEIPSYTPFSSEYRDIVERIGLDESTLEDYLPLFHRFNRKTMVKPENFLYERRVEGVLLKFELPRGSYATNIIRFLFNAV